MTLISNLKKKLKLIIQNELKMTLVEQKISFKSKKFQNINGLIKINSRIN